MDFDLRLPIGLLLTLVGVLVAGFGLLAPAASTSLGVNVDLAWGAVLLVTGVAMTALAVLKRGGARRP